MGCLQPKEQIELTFLFVGKDMNLKRIIFPDYLTVKIKKTDKDTIRKSREIKGKKIELEFQDFKFDSLEPKQSESKNPSVIIYLCDTEMKKSFDEIKENNVLVKQIFPEVTKVIMGFKLTSYQMEVEKKDIEKLAQEIDAYYYYVTERSDINGYFADIIKIVLSKIKKAPEMEEGKGCCK